MSQNIAKLEKQITEAWQNYLWAKGHYESTLRKDGTETGRSKAPKECMFEWCARVEALEQRLNEEKYNA